MTATPARNTADTPPSGSPGRAAILDVARVPAEQELGTPVQFVVKQLQVLDGWAFLHAQMQGPGGQPVDYRGTPHEAAAERGHKSDRYAALLRQQHDAWQVLAYSLGSTDMAWVAWGEEYGAPSAIFPAHDSL
ncbi:hypothetical protein ACPPVV_15525 [Rhodanobacter sp. Col0626]|uniref:hypothetical protein n=1 Tax=Rhodanobacter sp. Col0626 TaxID=3415679 RepID=UPI003CF16586